MTSLAAQPRVRFDPTLESEDVARHMALIEADES